MSAKDSSLSEATTLHKLRLRVFSLQNKVNLLEHELADTKRIALDALIEIRALKQISTIMGTYPTVSPSTPPQPILNTPEDYSQGKAEEVVNSLFDSIDVVFGRPRGT